MHPQGLGYQFMGMDFHMLRYLSTLGCIPIYSVGVPESMGMHPHSLGVPEGTQVCGSASPRTGAPHGTKVYGSASLGPILALHMWVYSSSSAWAAKARLTNRGCFCLFVYMCPDLKVNQSRLFLSARLRVPRHQGQQIEAVCCLLFRMCPDNKINKSMLC